MPRADYFAVHGFALIFVAAVVLTAVVAPARVYAGGGCHGSPGSAFAAVAADVDIEGCVFAPAAVRVAPGTAVTFTPLAGPRVR